MTKISSKTAYPKKKPISSDYFVGTDSEDFNKTVNFGFEEVVGLVNKLNGTPLLNYLFSTSPYLSTEVLLEGRFLSDENELSTPLLTKLYVNKFNNSGDNLQEFYLFLQTNATDFYLKLRNSNDQNNAVYFDIASVDDFPDYFILNIAVFKENEFFPLLENLNVYFFNFELKVTVAGTSDPLKLDKSTYTGNAKNLDDRIIALENFQDTNTKFTGQAFAVWTGSGFIYDVIYPDYYIQGVLYSGATEQITLNAADATHPRLDVIAVDATGAIKVAGTAEANPNVPTIDSETTIQITTVLVIANATTPTVTEKAIYKENTEWTTASNNGTVNFNATSTPFQGTKHIDCGAFTNGQYLRFTDNVINQITYYDNLKFYLNLKAIFASTARLSIRFFNGATLVSSTLQISTGTYNFVRTIVNSYQIINIPLTAFTFSSSSFDRIEIVTVGTNSSGFKIDNIILFQGNIIATPLQKAITTIITDSGVVNATSPDDTISMIGAGKTTISASGKIITVNTPSEVVNAITDGDLTHSPSGDAVFGGLALKVDKDGAKVLSDVNFSTALSNKLASIDATHYLAPLQTTIQLSALPQATVSDKARVYVENELSDYFYDVTATFGDIAPDDQVGGIGYWRKVAVGGETAASIKAKYESNADTNAFTDTLKAKLDSITAIFTTALKATYDGVVTGYDALMLTGSRLITSGEITKLSNTSGTNSGNETSTSIATINHAATPKTTLVDADEITGQNSATSFSLIRTVWSDVWTYIKSKADTYYQPKAITVVKISGTKTLSDADSGKVFILTASCTVTIPNGLSLGFNASFYTLTGATYTEARGGSVTVIGNTLTTMAEKKSCTITTTDTVNEYLKVGGE